MQPTREIQFGVPPVQPVATPAPVDEGHPIPAPASNQAPPMDQTMPAPYDDQPDGPEEEGAEDQLLSWSTPAEAGSHRSSQWYIIVGVISAALIIVAIFLRNWFFIPLGILVPIALTRYSGKGAEAHSYRLLTYGMEVDGKHHSYDDYKAFFEVQNDGKPVFELVPTQRFGALLTLHATNDIADDITEVLSSVLPETEPQGYLGESVFKRLKF